MDRSPARILVAGCLLTMAGLTGCRNSGYDGVVACPPPPCGCVSVGPTPVYGVAPEPVAVPTYASPPTVVPNTVPAAPVPGTVPATPAPSTVPATPAPSGSGTR